MIDSFTTLWNYTILKPEYAQDLIGVGFTTLWNYTISSNKNLFNSLLTAAITVCDVKRPFRGSFFLSFSYHFAICIYYIKQTTANQYIHKMIFCPKTARKAKYGETGR